MIEHLGRLLALREREPAPMAVLAFRIEHPEPSVASASEASALRRKIGLRLRAAVRASDVVAAIDDDSFALVLGSIVAPADGERVAAKLSRGAGAAVQHRQGRVHGSRWQHGVAHYPLDGKEAGRLLRRALSLAAAAPATSRPGPTTLHDSGGALHAAANDDR